MRAPLLLLCAISVSVPALAAPPDKAQCASSYTEAQRLRKVKKLVKAREALLVCAQDSCADFVRNDCTTWLREVEASLPTVVFEARGADGAFVTDVTVTSGGETLVSHLDGSAVPIDPGERALRFEHAGARPVEQTVVVQEGQKLQKVTVVFPDVGAAPVPSASASVAPPPSASAPPSASIPPPPSPAPLPWTFWALGGVGVAGLGVFTAFAISGLSAQSNLDSCKGSCSHSDVQSVRTKYLIGDIGLAVGAVALGGAAYVFFFGRNRTQENGVRATVGASMAPDGARAFVQGSF